MSARPICQTGSPSLERPSHFAFQSRRRNIGPCGRYAPWCRRIRRSQRCIPSCRKSLERRTSSPAPRQGISPSSSWRFRWHRRTHICRTLPQPKVKRSSCGLRRPALCSRWPTPVPAEFWFRSFSVSSCPRYRLIVRPNAGTVHAAHARPGKSHRARD